MHSVEQTENKVSTINFDQYTYRKIGCLQQFTYCSPVKTSEQLQYSMKTIHQTSRVPELVPCTYLNLPCNVCLLVGIHLVYLALRKYSYHCYFGKAYSYSILLWYTFYNITHLLHTQQRVRYGPDPLRTDLLLLGQLETRIQQLGKRIATTYIAGKNVSSQQFM